MSSVLAQTREDIRIFIPPVIAVRSDQAAFFQENFAIETAAAGYSLAEKQSEAEYNLKLEVKPNIILYDDGTEEQAPPDDKQFVLQVTLFDNVNFSEVVSFSFPFTDLEEMYDYNLYLLYEAIANVPLTKLGDEVIVVEREDDWWRNKWLYLRVSFDYPVVTTHQLKPKGLHGGNAIYDPNDTSHYKELDHQVRVVPGATVGLELQFLNWMSMEVDFAFRFGDPSNTYTFIPGLLGELKFPIKPSKHFMLEPFMLVSSWMDTADHYKHFPWLGVGGGFQLGIKSGNMGALFVDANFIYTVGDVVSQNPQIDQYPEPKNIHWNRYCIGIGIGYKLGLFDRNAGVHTR